jgi:hypothetical protein
MMWERKYEKVMELLGCITIGQVGQDLGAYREGGRLEK